MQQKYIDILLELGTKMHPHLGDDNHTNRLIRQLLTDKSRLSMRECFDLGKYYQRMLNDLDESAENHADCLHAILELKWAIG